MDLLDDLDTLLSENTDSTSKLSEVTNNIDLLDNDKELPKSNLRAPGDVLNDYTKLENDKSNIQQELDKFKQSHLDIFNEYQAILDKIAKVSDQQTLLKEELTESLENSGLKRISNNKYNVTFVSATIKTTFDRKKFEAKYPVLCKQFLKESPVKAYVKITEVN